MPIRDDLTPDEQKIMASEIAFEAEKKGVNPGQAWRDARAEVNQELNHAEEIKMENSEGLRDDYILDRDKTSGDRPDKMISNIDPITGKDIPDINGRPFIVDGNMTMYFESEETKQAYLNMPKDQAHAQLDNPNQEGEAEG